MRIALGSDRRGYEYKERIKRYLVNQGHTIDDVGPKDDSLPVDYPIYGKKVGEKIAQGICDKGIVICATGIGIMIACNKVRGVRCGIGYTDDVARLMREHNDANVISFGQSQMLFEDVKRRIDIFLNTEFLKGYHCSRVEQLKLIEENLEIKQSPILKDV